MTVLIYPLRPMLHMCLSMLCVFNFIMSQDYSNQGVFSHLYLETQLHMSFNDLCFDSFKHRGKHSQKAKIHRTFIQLFTACLNGSTHIINQAVRGQMGWG